MVDTIVAPGSILDNLDNGASASNQVITNTAIGSVTETAPITDIASSGLNGRLQRIAQRLSSLIGLLPTSLGTKTATNSLAVTLASDSAEVISLTSIANTQTITKTATQVVTTSGTSTQSSVVGGTTTRVILSATQDMWINIGSNPTASIGAGSFFLAAGSMSYPMLVTASVSKIAAIQDTIAGKLSILESV